MMGAKSAGSGASVPRTPVRWSSDFSSFMQASNNMYIVNDRAALRVKQLLSAAAIAGALAFVCSDQARPRESREARGYQFLRFHL
jgi:hypothetical protein